MPRAIRGARRWRTRRRGAIRARRRARARWRWRLRERARSGRERRRQSAVAGSEGQRLFRHRRHDHWWPSELRRRGCGATRLGSESYLGLVARELRRRCRGRGRSKRCGRRGSFGRFIHPRDDRERQPLGHAGLPDLGLAVDNLQAEQIVELLEGEDLDLVTDLHVPLIVAGNVHRRRHTRLLALLGGKKLPEARGWKSAWNGST